MEFMKRELLQHLSACCEYCQGIALHGGLAHTDLTLIRVCNGNKTVLCCMQLAPTAQLYHRMAHCAHSPPKAWTP